MYKSFGTSLEKRTNENRKKMNISEAERYEKARAAEIERERLDSNYWIVEEERESRVAMERDRDRDPKSQRLKEKERKRKDGSKRSGKMKHT